MLIKVVIALSIALLLSLAGNALQARNAFIAQGEANIQGKLDVAEAENVGLKQTQAVNTAIAGQKVVDTTELLADLRGIAEAARPVRIEYRRAAAAKPLGASCAPGQGRVDAVNARLGPQLPASATPGGLP